MKAGGGEKELEIEARQERIRSVQNEKNCAVRLPSKYRSSASSGTLLPQ
jgi:hypothetical protein